MVTDIILAKVALRAIEILHETNFEFSCTEAARLACVGFDEKHKGLISIVAIMVLSKDDTKSWAKKVIENTHEDYEESLTKLGSRYMALKAERGYVQPESGNS